MFNKDKVVHVLVGVPGSGKSTWAKSQGLPIVSSDEIRKSLYGDLNNPSIYDKEKHAEVFNQMRETAKELSKLNSPFIWDSTNLTRKSRYSLYQYLKSLDYFVILHFFIEPLSVLIERVNGRKDNIVPEEQIKKMYKSFEPPRLADDVLLDNDSIVVHTTTPFLKEGKFTSEFIDAAINDGIIKAIELLSEPYQKELSRTRERHDSPHHLERIDEHIDMCISSSPSTKFKIISAFHDLGKSVTKNEGKYYGHANVSSMYALLAFFGNVYNYSTVLEVIFQHMNAHNGISDKMINKHKFTKDELSTTMDFSEIDNISRIVGEGINGGY